MTVGPSQPMLEPFRAVVSNLPAGLILYDRDLRVVLAEGELLRSAGYDPELIRGRLLSEVLPLEAFTVLEGRYRDALAGIEQDTDYLSPVGGGRYRLRSRAVRDDTGAIGGGLLVTWDVSEQGMLQSQLEQAQSLIAFGSATYRRASGWVIEPTLLHLWGVDTATAPEQVIADVIVEEDRPRAEQAWADALRTGDPVSLEYTIRHGRTGELRHLQGTVRASLGQDGALLTAETTQVDVTDLAQARRSASAVEAANAAQRSQLLQQVSELLTSSADSAHDTLQAIAELAAVAIGDGALIRALSDDGTRIEALVFAHRTSEGRARFADWAATPDAEVWRRWAVPTGAAGSSAPSLGVIDDGDPAYPAWGWGCQYIRVPARHRGQVRGTIGLIRPGDSPPYNEADLELIQVLADRLGALLEADRAGAQARQLTAELQQINADQRALVLRMDSIEARERGRIADAVHDDPLQLAVASLLRLDSYRAQLPEADPGGHVVDAIASMLETCVDQMRTILGTLVPPDLTGGLGPALHRLADGIFLGTGVQVQVRGPDHVALDPSVKETIYRILHEAFVNARKHAQATTVTLDLAQDEQSVTLRLTDNGVGLAGAGSTASTGMAFGHLGLSSMRARAAAADAQLTLGDRVGGGTVVELVVPRHSEPGHATIADANASQGNDAKDSGPTAMGHGG